MISFSVSVSCDGLPKMTDSQPVTLHIVAALLPIELMLWYAGKKISKWKTSVVAVCTDPRPCSEDPDVALERTSKDCR